MLVCVANGFAVIRTPFDEKYDLIQKFRGIENESIKFNSPVDFMESGLMQKDKWDYWHIDVPFALNTDEAVPAFVNDGFIGANHGAFDAVAVYSPDHCKTIKDVGSLWFDESGVKFTLLRVEDEDNLLFISENAGTVEDYSFRKEIKGNLTFLENGKNVEDIVCYQQRIAELKRTIRYKNKRVVAFVGEKEIKARGEITCDYCEIQEEYDIINPATVAEALRKKRPKNGFCIAPDLANYGRAMISCRIVYRILQDGTILTIFDYKKLMNVRFQRFFGVMYQEKLDVYRGGIWRYFPKILPFKTGEGVFDFSTPTNIINSPYPESIHLTRQYWSDNGSPCERVVDYFRDQFGNDKLAFACGYLPVYDGLPKIRNKNILDVLHLIYTRKYYPMFAEGDLQNIKGVAYKKYFIPSKNKTSFYKIPFNGSTYIYADIFEKNTLEIPVKEKVSLLEKSADISYEISSDKLKVSGCKGFAVFVEKS